MLLCIQYACVERGIKLPWDDIARLLDPKATGGAAVQHLAKLRAKLIEQGQPVPPPLRRSGGAAAGRRIEPVETTGLPSPIASGSQESRASASKRGLKDETDSEGSDFRPHPAKRVLKRGTRSRHAMSGTGALSKNKGKAPMRGVSPAPATSQWVAVNSKTKRSGKNAKSNGRGGRAKRGKSSYDFVGPAAEEYEFSAYDEEEEDEKLVVVLFVSPSFSSAKYPRGLAKWAPGEIVTVDKAVSEADAKMEDAKNSDDEDGHDEVDNDHVEDDEVDDNEVENEDDDDEFEVETEHGEDVNTGVGGKKYVDKGNPVETNTTTAEHAATGPQDDIWAQIQAGMVAAGHTGNLRRPAPLNTVTGNMGKKNNRSFFMPANTSSTSAIRGFGNRVLSFEEFTNSIMAYEDDPAMLGGPEDPDSEMLGLGSMNLSSPGPFF